jgi:Gti1/Pac2 family transcription factor
MVSTTQSCLTRDGRLVQVSGGSCGRVCYATEASRRAYDQADLFCLCTDSRWSEEVASQFVSLHVPGDNRISQPADAYWTQETLDRLLTVDDILELRSLEVPPGTYLCARTNRMRETVSRSTRGAFSEGPFLPASPTPPYLSQRRPGEWRESPSLSPLSPDSGYAVTVSPRMYASDHGLSLAPLAHLEECRRLRRDRADEEIVRSFDFQRT